MIKTRRAVILPVVIFILLLLGLLVGTFSFKVNADSAAVRAAQNQLRTRMAAEAGIEKVKLLLRYGRTDRNSWWDNPDELNRIIIYSSTGGKSVWGTNEEFSKPVQAFRFSIVGDDPLDDEKFCRYGVTDEQSKINLNTATRTQLLSLVTYALGDNEEVDPAEIVDAILDWRDPDHVARSSAGDTEGEYYKNLPKPYNVKNGPFETVEELLLVKGVTTELLYGEDVDRNGLLTPNEDDADASYPMDNADGKLNRGIYPYLTVLSYDNNTSNDNRQRIYLKGDQNKVREALLLEFPDEPQVVDYVVNAVKSAGNRGGRQQRGGNQPGGQQPQDGSNQPGGNPNQQGAPGVSGQNPQDGGAGNPPNIPGLNPPPTGQPPAQPGTKPPKRGGNNGGKNDAARQQARQPSPEEQQGSKPPRNPRGGNRPGQTANPPPPPPPKGGDGNQPADGANPTKGGGQPGAGGTPPGSGAPGDPNTQPQNPQGGGNPQGDGSQPGGVGGNPPQGGSGNPPSVSRPMRSPADLFNPPIVNGVEQAIPLKPEHLAKLLDRTTLESPSKRKLVGLINVNSASPEVLRCLAGLPEEKIKAIVSTREGLSSEELATPAWLVTQGVLDMPTFQGIAPFITARGTQFMVESIGFADHVGTVTRLQVVVDMLGPIPQTIYYRDVSSLGGSFPIREQDKGRRHGK